MQHIKNYKIFESSFREDIQTQFLQACYDSDLERIKKLLQQGADINYNKPTTFGSVHNTPLIIACVYGKIEAVELLIKLGANISYVNDKGRNFLDVFPFYNRKAVLWLNSYRIQKIILSKDPSLFKSLKDIKIDNKNGDYEFKIHPRILKEFYYLNSADELSLL